MKVLIIVPAYNEELNILNTVKKIKRVRLNNDNLDYIVINDGSKDDTLSICQQNNIPVVNLIKNLGIGGAVQTGYKWAYYNNYDIAIQFDGDGQHDEKYIEKLVDAIKEGYDMVIGSRFIKKNEGFQSTLARKLGIKILSFLIKIFNKKKIKDPTSGFRAVNRKIIKEFAFNYPLEYPEPESISMLYNKNYKIKEVSVIMHEREFGTSSIRPLKSAYYMFSVSLAIIANWLFKNK